MTPCLRCGAQTDNWAMLVTSTGADHYPLCAGECEGRLAARVEGIAEVTRKTRDEGRGPAPADRRTEPPSGARTP